MDFFGILICILAGLGAGVGTGFAGMSAAAVISPMLIILLDVPAYEAIGIALASDVLASAISALTYAKNKNIDIRNGFIMMLSVLVFTFVGSLLSSYMPDNAMGGTSLIFMLILGVKFLVKPIDKSVSNMDEISTTKKVVSSIICGSAVGFVCGFVGAGGGMMMLFVLTTILGYRLKMAVGTSVFIMTFTAFTGAVSHFAIGGLPNWVYLDVCVISTLFFAVIASRIANKVNHKTLNRVVGVVLLVVGKTIICIEMYRGVNIMAFVFGKSLFAA